MEIGGDRAQLLIKLMSATALRDRWISSNIANQSVPGYKRRDVKFEELLQERIARKEPDLLSVEPEIKVDTSPGSGPEGNNVNLELETLGPLVQLAPGKSVTHTERWSLHRGVHLEGWSDEDLAAFEKAWLEVLKEESAKDPLFKKVADHYLDYRKKFAVWGNSQQMKTSYLDEK